MSPWGPHTEEFDNAKRTTGQEFPERRGAKRSLSVGGASRDQEKITPEGK